MALVAYGSQSVLLRAAYISGPRTGKLGTREKWYIKFFQSMEENPRKTNKQTKM